jgi:hypothetical protein
MPIAWSWRNADVRFRFGDLLVDSARLTIERDGTPVSVQPQVFDVLCYLVEHRDRVVPKTELLDQVWGGHHGGGAGARPRSGASVPPGDVDLRPRLGGGTAQLIGTRAPIVGVRAVVSTAGGFRG